MKKHIHFRKFMQDIRIFDKKQISREEAKEMICQIEKDLKRNINELKGDEPYV